MPFRNKQIVPINYTSRDYDSIRSDLLEHARRYYPETYQDFSEASFGSLMLDTVSYVGDILSFYLDYQVNESFIDTSVEYSNVVRHARQMGYRYASRASSTGHITFYIVVPPPTSGFGPDSAYLPILRRGSKFATGGGTVFSLSEDVNFSNPANEVVVATANSSTGEPTGYAVRAFGQVMSGEFVSELITIGEYRRFRRTKLSANNITEIISVVDSDGNEYFQVDHLSQNVIFKPSVNRGEDSQYVSSIMKPYSAPRRFVMENDGTDVFLQFGYGSEENLNTEKLLDPSKIILRQHGRDYITDKSFDPTVLIETDKLGVVPANTQLRVVCRVNSASSVNAGARTVTVSIEPSFIFTNPAGLDSTKVRDVAASLELENEMPILGDVSVPSADEVKHRAYGVYSSQNRAVTKQDYESLVYNMHPRYGSVKRCNAVRDADSAKRNINIYTISENADGNLFTTPTAIKNNLRTWLANYKMLNDTIDILDAKVVNFGINYTILVEIAENKHKILALANRAVRTRITRLKMDIGEPFRITDLYQILKNVDGVLDVVNVALIPKTGENYSGASYDFETNSTSDGRLLLAPENVVLEIKYPNIDIRGVSR